MSGTQKVFGVVKTVMLMHERFDALDQKVKRLDGDLTDLSRSHMELAQKVAAMDGYIRGRSDQAAAQARRPEIGHD